MAINFPSTTGQATDGSFTHVVGYVTYKWNGVSWNASASGNISDINEIGNVDTTGLATGEFFVYDGTNWSPNDGIVYNTGTSTGLHPQYLVIKDSTGLGFGTGNSGGDPDVFFDWTSSGTTGSLTIAPNTSTIATYDVYLKGSGSNGGISILNSGAVELYYGSSGKKLETSAQGINVTGRIAAESLSLDVGGSITAAGTTIDFQNSTISFSGASIGGLQGTINGWVDTHLNQSGPTDGNVLSWDTSANGGNGDYAWVPQSGGTGLTKEPAYVTTTPISSDSTFDLANGNVQFRNSTAPGGINAAAALTFGGSNINTFMAVNDVLTFTIICTGAAGSYFNGLTIDGSTQTVNWAGGSAPTDGSAKDMYVFTIVKTAASTYTVIGNQTKTA
tara:strand:- start:1093 stop:2259 length:1167 start_codon:yes stop_codon:yes gene_type:complete